MARTAPSWPSDRPLGASARIRFDVARLPELLLAFGVVGAPLAIGGVHLPTKLVLAALMVAGFGLQALLLHRVGTRVRVGWVGLAFLVALAYAALQWVPLPAGLVELLAPSAHEARSAAAAAVGGLPPSWEPLTLDPSRTASALVTLLAIGFAYLLAMNLWEGPSGRARAAVYVEAAALATLFVGALHAGLGLEQLYGLYTPTISVGERLLPTPFVNPNHAAALFLLAAFVAFGRWLDAERDAPWHLTAGVAASVGLLATFSRANALLWLAGLLALGLLTALRPARPDVRPRYLRLIVGAAAVAVVAVILLGPDRWAGELASLGTLDSPLQSGLVTCWQVGADITSAHLWLGVGAGAFEVAAPVHMQDWAVGLVSHAHNAPLQVLAELGVVVGGAVLALFAAGFVRLTLRARKSVAALGASVGVAALLAQNLVDFSLWLPGVALPAAAALGAIGSAAAGKELRCLRLRWPLPATVAVAGLLTLAGLQALHEHPERTYATALAAVGDPGADVPLAAGQLVSAHPADFYAFHLAGALAARAGDTSLAARLLDRAHTLAPYEPEVLVRRARLHITAQTPPATVAEDLERLASFGPRLRDRALDVLLTPGASQAVMEAFLAVDVERVLLLSRKLPLDPGERLLLWGLAREPDALTVMEELGRRWAVRPERADALDRLATDLLARLGADPPPTDRPVWARLAYLLQGYVLRRNGDHLGAWHMFIEAADQVEAQGVEPLLAAGEVASVLDRLDLLEPLVARLAVQPVDEAAPKSRLHYLKSRAAELGGDLRKAIQEMQRALRYRRDVPGYEERLAGLFTAVGEPTAASAAQERAAALRRASAEAAPPKP